MKIPIRKTNRKVPRSRYRVFVYSDYLTQEWAKDIIEDWGTYPRIQDISIGLDDPLILLPSMHKNWVKAMNAQETINQIYNKMQSDFLEAIRNPKITSTYPERIPGTKPSLLTRVKERFKR